MQRFSENIATLVRLRINYTVILLTQGALGFYWLARPTGGHFFTRQSMNKGGDYNGVARFDPFTMYRNQKLRAWDQFCLKNTQKRT